MKVQNIQSGFFLFFGILLCSCSKQPQPIDYGNDACHYCQMTIVDKIHGAEVVTDKGKIFKFDSAECLMRFSNDLVETDGYQFLTNYFESSEALIPIENATFLISEEIPSPMGAYLTAFESQQVAEATKRQKGGKIYNWKEIKNHINAN